MQIVTTNYGLAGGTLDSSAHLERAIPRLCNTHASQQLLAILAANRQMNSSSRN